MKQRSCRRRILLRRIVSTRNIEMMTMMRVNATQRLKITRFSILLDVSIPNSKRKWLKGMVKNNSRMGTFSWRPTKTRCIKIQVSKSWWKCWRSSSLRAMKRWRISSTMPRHILSLTPWNENKLHNSYFDEKKWYIILKHEFNINNSTSRDFEAFILYIKLIFNNSQKLNDAIFKKALPTLKARKCEKCKTDWIRH